MNATLQSKPEEVAAALSARQLPKLIIPAPLWCPRCGKRHVDETRNNERWDRRAHTTHRCQSCGQDFDVYVSGAPPVEEQADAT